MALSLQQSGWPRLTPLWIRMRAGEGVQSFHPHCYVSINEFPGSSEMFA
jgi:hypothetical protein